MSWLNVGSLLLGLVAWALPIMGIIKKRSLSDTHHILLVLSSMGAALLAVFFQLLYNWYLVSIEDFGALSDTMYAIVFAAFILIVATILLNGISIRERNSMKK